MELPSFYSIFLWNILPPRTQKMRHDKKPIMKYTAMLAKMMVVPTLLLGLTEQSRAQTYSILELKQDTAKFLAEQYSQIEHSRIDIDVGNLDSRLRLSRCEQPLLFNAQDQTGLGGNISVQARCESGNKWSLHIPAQVMIYREIPVAARDIARGELLQASHLNRNLINISNIRQGFSLEEDSIIGRETKRNISAGEPFRTAALDAPTAIKRGESVILQAQASGIKVSSSGTALADGRVGQKIRVRNNSSDRIVTGLVMSQGLVQTL